MQESTRQVMLAGDFLDKLDAIRKQYKLKDRSEALSFIVNRTDSTQIEELDHHEFVRSVGLGLKPHEHVDRGVKLTTPAEKMDFLVGLAHERQTSFVSIVRMIIAAAPVKGFRRKMSKVVAYNKPIRKSIKQQFETVDSIVTIVTTTETTVRKKRTEE